MILAQAPACVDDQPLCRFLLDRTGSELVARLGGEVLPTILKIVLILVVAAVATGLLRRGVSRFVRRVGEQGVAKLGALRERAPLADTRPIDLARMRMRTETIGGVLRSLGSATIWTIAVVMALGAVNINLGPLIAGAGIVGVALGFGAQSLVKDFISGMFLLLEDQYGIGDFVDVGEANGVVEAITLRTTRLRDVEGTVWYVPNGEIRRVGNKSQQWARSLIDVGVAYGSDLDHVQRVIKRVADELWQDPDWNAFILEEPEVWGVEAFGPNEVLIRVVLKVEPATQWKVNRQLRARLKAAFDAEGIEIPFPQRTVWVRNAPETEGKR